MTTIVIDRKQETRSATSPTGRTISPPRRLRPGWGTGRRTGPPARPSLALSGPRLSSRLAPAVAGCRVDPPTAAPVLKRASRWRLTDRGIALVLATGLAIATAALVVVALTAYRVTGDGYAAAGQIGARP